MKATMFYECHIFFAVLYFSSCASLTGYQDGKSVGEGNGEAMISLNFSQSPTFADIEE